MDIRLYSLTEQASISCQDLFGENASDKERLHTILSRKEYNPDSPQELLGLDWDYPDRTLGTIQANYFIGCQWLQEESSAMMVIPKIKNLDFMTMFLKCFDSSIVNLRDKLSEIYYVNLNAMPIDSHAIDLDITPLLIAHFVKLIEAITAKGLKKDYVLREESLHGKVKGKLILGKLLNRYVNTGRQDIMDCIYQDYTADNIENRIIKKALLFANTYFQGHTLSSECDIQRLIHTQLSFFSNIGTDVSIQQIKHHRTNPLFKEYKEALKLAKMILCRFGYTLEHMTSETARKSTPPFWINMPLLFELYAYALLQEEYKEQIDYHLSTYGNEIDFVKYNEQCIIDAKYIPDWEDRINHDNVRQLSGYARNISLRRQIMKDRYDSSSILPCLILYPENNIGSATPLPPGSILQDVNEVSAYVNIFKKSLQLPLRKAGG